MDIKHVLSLNPLKPVYAGAPGPVTEPDQLGSFLELSWGWARPFAVGDETRTALEDGDEVVLRATAGTVTLGEVSGRVVPA